MQGDSNGISFETTKYEIHAKVNGLRKQHWRHLVSTENTRFLSSPVYPDRIMHLRSPIFGRFWVLSRWQRGQEVKLTTRLDRLQRLRFSGVIPLFPIYALMAWTEINFYFLL